MVFIIQTVAELFLSPVGLSTTSALAPKSFASDDEVEPARRPLVASLSREELFTSGQRAWASSTPSAWPVAKWIHINTVAPFTSFRTRIRAWKRR